MDTKERLAELIKSLGLTQAAFAVSINASPGNVSEWLSKANKNPSLDALVRICEKHRVNLNWLLTGEGQMFTDVTVVTGPLGGSVQRMPILAEIAGGEPLEVYNDEPLGYIDVPLGMLHYPPPYYVFRVSGRSMEPWLMDGDTVVISRDWRGLKLRDKIIAFRTPDGITLKKYVVDGRRAWLWPLNRDFSPIPYYRDTADLRMLGILDISIRQFNRE